MRPLKFLLPLGIALHLGITLWRTDPGAAASLLDVSAGWLVLAFVFAFFPWLTNGLRLWNWLRWEGERRPFLDCLRIVVASEVGAAVTPTSVGSASVKTAMLSARGIPLPRALSLTGMGSLEDGLFFVMFVPPVLVFSAAGSEGLFAQAFALLDDAFETPTRVIFVALTVLVLAFGFARTRWGRATREILARSWHEWRRLLGRACTQQPLSWSMNLVLASLQWVARYSVLTALLYGLGLEIDPVRAFVLQWLCFTIMALVPTPGAMGGAELVFLGLFARDVPADVLALVMSAWRMLTFYLLNGIGLAVLLAGARGNDDAGWFAERPPTDGERSAE